MNARILAPVIAIASVLLGAYPSAASGTLRVDFNRDVDVSRDLTQSGFEPWAVEPTGGTSFSAAKSFSFADAADGTVDITATIGNNAYARDYTTIASPAEAVPYTALLEDWLFFNNSWSGNNYLQLAFDDLKAGVYEFVAWHNSANFANGIPAMDVQIAVGGAGFTDSGVDAVIRGPATSSANNGKLPDGAPYTSQIEFTVPANDAQVLIKYANPNADNFGLNGFRLYAVTVQKPRGTVFSFN